MENKIKEIIAENMGLNIKEHGALFNGHMVLVTKAGIKLQTRRPITYQNSICGAHVTKKEWDLLRFDEAVADFGPLLDGYSGPYLKVPFLKDIIVPVYPRHRVNDNIWVRETWKAWEDPDTGKDYIHYLADDSKSLPKGFDITNQELCNRVFRNFKNWESSMHMLRAISRFVMPIIKMRVERIQDISPADCINEGIFPDVSSYDVRKMTPTEQYSYYGPAITRFKSIWNGIYRAQGFGWDANPLVWVSEWKGVR